MTYYLVVGGERTRDLATTSGWADFKAWTDGLSETVYPELVHLIDWAWSQELGPLLLELKQALKAAKPADSSVEATLRDLIDSVALGVAMDAASVFVTDGMTEPDDDDDDCYHGELVDQDTQDVFEVEFDAETNQWTVSCENAARAAECAACQEYLAFLARHYEPAMGPFLRYALWHAERFSQLTLRGGLPEEDDDPTRVY